MRVSGLVVGWSGGRSVVVDDSLVAVVAGGDIVVVGDVLDGDAAVGDATVGPADTGNVVVDDGVAGVVVRVSHTRIAHGHEVADAVPVDGRRR